MPRTSPLLQRKKNDKQRDRPEKQGREFPHEVKRAKWITLQRDDHQLKYGRRNKAVRPIHTRQVEANSGGGVSTANFYSKSKIGNGVCTILPLNPCESCASKGQMVPTNLVLRHLRCDFAQEDLDVLVEELPQTSVLQHLDQSQTRSRRKRDATGSSPHDRTTARQFTITQGASKVLGELSRESPIP